MLNAHPTFKKCNLCLYYFEGSIANHRHRDCTFNKKCDFCDEIVPARNVNLHYKKHQTDFRKFEAARITDTKTCSHWAHVEKRVLEANLVRCLGLINEDPTPNN
jgi:hypothetical protein